MIDKFFVWLGQSKGWKWFANNIIAKVNFRFLGYPTLDSDELFKIVDIINNQKDSAIYAFASSDDKSLASILIRWITGETKHSHAGLILPGNDREIKALHMKGDGVHHEHLLKVLEESDRFTVVKIDLSKESHLIAKNRIQEILDKKDQIVYDFAQMLSTDEKLYCSELVYKVVGNLLPEEKLILKYILGREAFDPEAVLELGRIIYPTLS